MSNFLAACYISLNPPSSLIDLGVSGEGYEVVSAQMNPARDKIRPRISPEAPMAILFLSDSGMDGSEDRQHKTTHSCYTADLAGPTWIAMDCWTTWTNWAQDLGPPGTHLDPAKSGPGLTTGCRMNPSQGIRSDPGSVLRLDGDLVPLWLRHGRIWQGQTVNRQTGRDERVNGQTGVERTVKPSVVMGSTMPPAGKHPAMLVCSVYDFYPKQIRMVTGTTRSTHLEYTPRSGEKISCVVEHPSLKEPLI
ncbi:H-2 class II histocompatibility antigen, E-S beta chain-like protein, partial [Lates japonicus]